MEKKKKEINFFLIAENILPPISTEVSHTHKCACCLKDTETIEKLFDKTLVSVL